VFRSAHSRHHTSSHVLHGLKFLKINFGDSSQRRVTVVKPTVNRWMESLSSQGALGRNMSGRQQSPAEAWTADHQEPRRGSWPYCQTQQLSLSAGDEWQSAWLAVAQFLSRLAESSRHSISVCWIPIYWSRPSTHAANWAAAVFDSNAGTLMYNWESSA